jgi:DNA invertase Pin-like site-specific DNA recombinase
MNRPGWQALLKDARPGDTIVIWRVDRLTRSVYEGLDTVITLLNPASLLPAL